VSSYGKVTASVASAEILVATLAEREHGAVAGPEALERTRTIAAITSSTRGFAGPETDTPSRAIGEPLQGQDEKPRAAPSHITRGHLVRVVQWLSTAT